MWPELFSVDLFGREFPLRSFGVLVAIAFLIGVWMAGKLSERYGDEGDKERLPDVAWWVLIGIIAGGRLGYVLVYLGDYARDPLRILFVWEGGLVFYGGVILAVLLGAWKARQVQLNVWKAADYCLTAGFLGQAIGRVGCLLVGDDYGGPTDVPWGMRLPEVLPQGSLFPEELVGMVVHPTQPYMSLKALALFGLGLFLLKRKRFDGQVATILAAGYAVLRFVVEAFRWDDAARGGIFREGLDPESVAARLHELGVADVTGRIHDVAGYQRLLVEGVEGIHPELLLSTSQMVSLALFPVAILLFVYAKRRAHAG